MFYSHTCVFRCACYPAINPVGNTGEKSEGKSIYVLPQSTQLPRSVFVQGWSSLMAIIMHGSMGFSGVNKLRLMIFQTHPKSNSIKVGVQLEPFLLSFINSVKPILS